MPACLLFLLQWINLVLFLSEKFFLYCASHKNDSKSTLHIQRHVYNLLETTYQEKKGSVTVSCLCPLCAKEKWPISRYFNCFTGCLSRDVHRCYHICCWLSHSYEFYCKISPPNVCEGQIVIKSVPLRGGNPEARSKLVLVTNTWTTKIKLCFSENHTAKQHKSEGFSFLLVLMVKSYRDKMSYSVMSWLPCDSFPVTTEKLHLTL